MDEVEVTVVLDAAASDAAVSEAGCSRIAPRVMRAERPGASAARNAGWQSTSAPLVLFLDDDIVPTPRLVSEHLDWHRREPRPEVGVVGLVKWSPRVKVNAFMRWLDRGIQFDYDRIVGTEVGWQLFYSCNVSVKRTLLERVGGFDEHGFPFGYEDLELARRMSEHGLRLLYNEKALGEHVKTETIEGWRRNLRRIARAERLFVTLYPEERPYFYERFRDAADAPPARGRSASLAKFVRPGVPWLGRVVWRSYDLVCSQRLAPEFLSEWEAAAAAAQDEDALSSTSGPKP